MKRWDEAVKRLPAGAASAVEVGVWKGQMSLQLLAARPHLTLYLVDLWLPGSDNTSWLQSGSQMATQSREAVDAAFARVRDIARQFAPRAHVVREASASAAQNFDDGSLDLVFIDADHSQLAVMADVQAWRPKVKLGGWIGGHDFGSPRFPGVEAAVLLSFPRASVELGANSTWWVRR